MNTPYRSRRCLVMGALLTLGAGMTLPAYADSDYPTRPIRMIVAFGAGTTTDTIARLLSEKMSASLGKPVIVENRAGAGGSIGTDAVAKAAPDGYTLSLGTVGTFAINKSLYSKLAYDPKRDFEPISVVGYTPTLLVTRYDSPLNSVQDLVAYTRNNPGKVTFASAGSGTSGHLSGAMLSRLSKQDMLHIPYKEGAQAVTAVMSGETDFMFYHPTAVMGQIQAKRLKALGVSSAKRSRSAPDVPTIEESGYQPFDLTAWFMLAGPKGLPPAVLDKLETAARTALADPGLARKLAEQGIEPSDLSRDKLPAFLDEEIDKWAAVVQQAGAAVD